MERRTIAAPLVLLVLLDPASVLAAWRTLSGKAPIVIANGGTSGLYPDQTYPAYQDALTYSLSGVVISCDLQIAKSARPELLGTGICRKGLDLSNSTYISNVAPHQWETSHVVDNENITGWFAIDITFENLTNFANATQSNLARTSVYDNLFPLVKPEYIPGILSELVPDNSSTWWLNNEYTHFIEENTKFNVTDYLVGAIPALQPGYISSTEANLLQDIQSVANASGTKLIYKFLDKTSIDPSNNQTYGSLLRNLTQIKTFASGILVPKSYIWPIDPTSLYLLSPTTLVNDAHSKNLEVFAYDFVNDQYPTSYNYTFDPVTEVLYFIEGYNFSVDGIFTDFPTTASEAIACYSSNGRNVSLDGTITKKQKVISHNGYSGKYPGATILSYQAAIDAGVDYIDCIVQITSDSVPICRTTVNLVDTTNVANTVFFETSSTTYPGFNGGLLGVYTFDLTWANISTLRSVMYSPEASCATCIAAISRDPHYDGQFGIMSLADFLAFVKNKSVGALIDIQNAVYLRESHNLAAVDAVALVLSEAGLNSSQDIILQSEDSSALARLRELNVDFPLMYRVIWSLSNPISLSETDFVDIKQYASSVNLHVRLIEPFDPNYFLEGPPIKLVGYAHAQNLTVYFQYQRNEFTVFANDLKEDPTLELHLLVHYYGIDGIVTDFPPTVLNYFGAENQCSGTRHASSVLNYSIPVVIPGVLSYSPSPDAPAPDLVVVQAPLSGISLNSSLSPAPAIVNPSSAFCISSYFVFTFFSVVLHLLSVV